MRASFTKHSRRLVLASLVAAGSVSASANLNPYIEEIVVSATRTAQPAQRLPVAVSRLDRAVMQRRNYRSTPEALVHQPGVLVQKTAHGQGSPFIRGLTGKQVLILVDGMRLNNATFRFGPNQYLATIGLGSIDRVEILRGPASVLYGSDALGGVINVITEPAGSTSFNEIRTTYGSGDHQRSLQLQSRLQAGDWHLTGGGSTSVFGDVRGGGDVGKQNHTGYREHNLHGAAQYQLANGGRIRLSAQDSQQHDVPRTDKFTDAAERYVFEHQTRRAANASIELPVQWALADQLQVRLLHQRQGEDFTRQKFNSDRVLAHSDSVRTHGAALQLQRDFGADQLVYGAEWYADTVSSDARQTVAGEVSTAAASFPDGARYTSQAGYAQYILNAGELTSLTGGLRYSRFNASARLANFGRLREDYDELTASLGWSYEVQPDWRIFASIASGFRAPNLDDLVVLKSTNEGIDVPSPGLAPEQVRNYELGLKHATPAWQMTATAFHSAFKDLIDRRPGTYLGLPFIDLDGDGLRDSDEDAVIQKFNVGRAEIHGIEIDVSVNLSERLRTFANLTYTRGEDTTSNQPLSRIPPTLAMLGLHGEARSGRWWWEFMLSAARRQDRLSARDRADPRIPDAGTPGYVTLNLLGGWQLGAGQRLDVALQNLADRKYKVHGSGLFEPGRAIKVAYAITF